MPQSLDAAGKRRYSRVAIRDMSNRPTSSAAAARQKPCEPEMSGPGATRMVERPAITASGAERPDRPPLGQPLWRRTRRMLQAWRQTVLDRTPPWLQRAVGPMRQAAGCDLHRPRHLPPVLSQQVPAGGQGVARGAARTPPHPRAGAARRAHHHQPARRAALRQLLAGAGGVRAPRHQADQFSGALATGANRRANQGGQGSCSTASSTRCCCTASRAPTGPD